VGGPGDDTGIGAAWVYYFTPSSGAWTQQGDKLVGTGAVGSAYQGVSVALSADGNTAIIGGFLDNVVSPGPGTATTQLPSVLPGVTIPIPSVLPGIPAATGTAWVFTRSGGVWTQQGGKLVGTGAVGAANQGASVALSGDGNMAVMGGPSDNSNAGAAWVFTRSGGVWTQQGGKVVATDAVGSAYQGVSVALSGDGNTAIVGGPGDNSNAGAAWVY
jgi:hypothetical protein